MATSSRMGFTLFWLMLFTPSQAFPGGSAKISKASVFFNQRHFSLYSNVSRNPGWATRTWREPVTCHQGGRSCETARPPVSASAGAPALAGSPSIHAFVAKSVLSRFTRFWMYRFQPFMVMNGYFMIMMLVQGF